MVYAMSENHESRAISCTQKYSQPVMDQPSDDTVTMFHTYSGQTDSNSLVTSSEPPSTMLQDLRLDEGESPWIVRHNFSYIKSEHPDREGSYTYGMDRRGSFALCAMASPVA